ncbi:MAG: 30S ribosomal protein S20 [Candidatus Moeniiplasma glomeromycotorum]|nr:30S ribosomal protein S20 [Candidatus Moeniiplasma glomeromycotorum]MCE8167388.1 30S ribosomal protein S20 [Candidatus Moeniiplasma glomeromycotorum]MCE8168599.1 30S ribosomal protein S20 [Candidatus Moeniiplasma glomeromycotorum]
MSVSQQLKNKKRQSQNRKYKKLIKVQLKKVKQVLAEKNLRPEEVKKTISETQKVLDKTARKGIIHAHKSARQKSKIQKNFNQWKATQNI